MHEGDIGMNVGPIDEMDISFIRDNIFAGSFPDSFPFERWKAREPYPVKIGQASHEYTDFQLEVYHTPGHTLGQAAYLIKPFGYLIIGDTIVHGKAWLQLPESTEIETYRQSVLKLKSLCLIFSRQLKMAKLAALERVRSPAQERLISWKSRTGYY